MSCFRTICLLLFKSQETGVFFSLSLSLKCHNSYFQKYFLLGLSRHCRKFVPELKYGDLASNRRELYLCSWEAGESTGSCPSNESTQCLAGGSLHFFIFCLATFICTQLCLIFFFLLAHCFDHFTLLHSLHWHLLAFWIQLICAICCHRYRALA